MRKYNLYNKITTFIVAMSLFSVSLFYSCNDPELEQRTNFEELIGEFLENNFDEYGDFVKIIYRAESMSFLKAYGGYTVFAPDNRAVNEYLGELGVSSIEEISKEELKDLLKYHVIKDTISTTEFIDGRMNTQNEFGHYVTTGTYFEGGQPVIKVNKYAKILEKDIRMANGIIHKIGDVIRPEKKPAAQVIDENDNYSIFAEALKATGWYDTLMIADGPHTVFAVSNEAYAKESIKSFQDLLGEIAPGTENLKDTLNDLNKYIGYHILKNNLRYVTDLIADRAALTRAHNEVITIKMSGAKVLVNDDLFAGIHEPGFEMDRPVSDRTVLNGVVHEMKEDFRIKVRNPFAVYWDVAEQIEIMKIPGVFRRPGGHAYLDNGQLENIVWYGEKNRIEYKAGLGGNEGWHVFDDRIDVNLRPEVIQWIEFKTPILVAGEYKLWVCTRNVHGDNNRKAIYYAYFNDEVLPNIINNRITLNNIVPEAEREQEGFKLYGWKPDDLRYYRVVDEDTFDITQSQYMNKEGAARMTGQLAGTIKVETTGIHTLKFVGITGTNGAWFDMMHFIPVEEDQLWPRVNTKTGELVYKEEINALFEEYKREQAEKQQEGS